MDRRRREHSFNPHIIIDIQPRLKNPNSQMKVGKRHITVAQINSELCLQSRTCNLSKRIVLQPHFCMQGTHLLQQYSTKAQLKTQYHDHQQKRQYLKPQHKLKKQRTLLVTWVITVINSNVHLIIRELLQGIFPFKNKNSAFSFFSEISLLALVC